jgi:hypothetical protein
MHHLGASAVREESLVNAHPANTSAAKKTDKTYAVFMTFND